MEYQCKACSGRATSFGHECTCEPSPIAMDEHDKRAREVAEAVLGPLNADAAYIAFVAARIGTLFRGLTAAAVAAERERCRTIAAEFGADDAWHPERRHASSSIADAIAAAPIAAAASPAQAMPPEVADLARKLGMVAAPAQAERVSEARPLSVQEVWMDGAAAERSRIAARLRARADEDGRAGRLDIAAALRSEADALEGT